jgi:predicted nucleic acid-binding protein
VYTLDTNAIIYYLDEDPAVVPVLEPILAQEIAIFVSIVTELELLSHPGLTEEDIAEIAQVLTSMVVFPLESRLAQLAGALRRQYRLKTPDSIVATTALLTHTTLVTRRKVLLGGGCIVAGSLLITLKSHYNLASARAEGQHYRDITLSE